VAGGVIGGALAVSTALGGVLALPLVAGSFGAWLLYVKGAQGIRKSAELIAQDRLDEAAVSVEALDKTWMPFPTLRGYVAGHAGAISWRRGNLRAALAHTQRAVEQLERKRFGSAGPVYWMQLLNRVQLLAALGQTDDALAQFEKAKKVPTGNWLEMERQFTELFLAFCLDDSTRVPAELHQWVRATLQTNVFGGNVVLLAWVYDRRGDADMAAHLLEESEMRLERWHLDRTFPKLWRWREAARVRLKVELGA
jgi:tetratricopeptide (TPR) repeat protein